MITVILYLRKIGWLNKDKQKEKALHGNAGQSNTENSESVNNQNLQEMDETYGSTKGE